MIVPNLMTHNIAESVQFYQDVVGMQIGMSVGPERSVHMGELGESAVFVTMKWGAHELMLQSPASLAEDLTGFDPTDPSGTGTIYFRGLDPEAAATRATAEQTVKGPEDSWYGMRELYLRDPSGHIVCLGCPVTADP